MTEIELGTILKSMYDNALEKEKSTNIHLFGIKYADIIRDSKYKPIDIVRAAALPESYVVEINKGIKLSKYVIPK